MTEQKKKPEWYIPSDPKFQQKLDELNKRDAQARAIREGVDRIMKEPVDETFIERVKEAQKLPDKIAQQFPGLFGEPKRRDKRKKVR